MVIDSIVEHAKEAILYCVYKVVLGVHRIGDSEVTSESQMNSQEVNY